jgi:hypothetical protein
MIYHQESSLPGAVVVVLVVHLIQGEALVVQLTQLIDMQAEVQVAHCVSQVVTMGGVVRLRQAAGLQIVQQPVVVD